jgi:sulfate transport system ATP-binding protein
MIAGLEKPDNGDIIIEGKVVNDVPASERGIGFVFQNYALFKYMTVFDNIAFGLQVQKKSKDEIKERVNELIELTGLSGLEKRYPSQLSGGQRQRVAFARALAPNPKLLLLDEPFAAIDAKIRQELRCWLKEMIGKLGITSIFVTHDQYEAIEVSDEIIVTNSGRIEQIGSPLDIYRNPKTAFTASFFGHATSLKDYTKYKTFEDVENSVTSIVRPEFIKVSKKGEFQQYENSVFEGVVEQVTFRGDYLEARVRIGDDILIAHRTPEESPVDVGEDVDVFIYRLFVITDDGQVHLITNKALQENSVVI